MGGLEALTYPRAPRAEEALQLANQVILPLLRGARGYVRVYEAYTRMPHRVTSLASSGDKRIHVLVVDIPFSRPLVVAIYASTQRSRPVSPSQLRRRLARLARLVAKLRNTIGSQADIIPVYLSATRLTRGAYREALRSHVYVALSPTKARQYLASYLKRRLRALLSKTRGAPHGRVAVLAYALNSLATATDPGSRQEGDSLARKLLTAALTKPETR